MGHSVYLMCTQSYVCLYTRHFSPGQETDAKRFRKNMIDVNPVQRYKIFPIYANFEGTKNKEKPTKMRNSLI